MPNNQALQSFSGSLPVLLAFLGGVISMLRAQHRDSLLLKTLLDRLGAVELRLCNLEDAIHQVDNRLTVLG